MSWANDDGDYHGRGDGRDYPPTAAETTYGRMDRRDYVEVEAVKTGSEKISIDKLELQSLTARIAILEAGLVAIRDHGHIKLFNDHKTPADRNIVPCWGLGLVAHEECSSIAAEALNKAKGVK